MSASSFMFLVPIAGPPIEPIRIEAGKEPLTIGRHESCSLKVPSSADGVSRFHARFRFDSLGWRVADLGSRWGTSVNGTRLAPHCEMLLSPSDVITILPWTFSLTSGSQHLGVVSENDFDVSMVRTVASNGAPPISSTLLTVLLEASASIHSANSEADLAERLIDAAIRGTGLPNAALLRPLNVTGRLEVLASRRQSMGGNTEFAFSRKLIAAAANGAVAELSSSSNGDISQSIFTMSVSAALCVPLMLGPSVAAYLYLDARSNGPVASQPLRESAADFAAAIGRLASLALANLKRIDLTRRQLWLDGELRAAAAAQKWILPDRSFRVGPYHFLGESRSGQSVGGDFFDAFELPGGRFAITIGDVSGKGIPASVLMTSAQGFLHASLLATGDPALAVTALNHFIAPRRPDDRFITLWTGVFDPNSRELRFVDAGHGYAWMAGAGGSIDRLGSEEGFPIGFDADCEYRNTVIPLPDNATVLVVTDGIIEQFGSEIEGNVLPSPRQYHIEGVTASLKKHDGGDLIAGLFADVIRHAGGEELGDDATAIAVRWRKSD